MSGTIPIFITLSALLFGVAIFDVASRRWELPTVMNLPGATLAVAAAIEFMVEVAGLVTGTAVSASWTAWILLSVGSFAWYRAARALLPAWRARRRGGEEDVEPL